MAARRAIQQRDPRSPFIILPGNITVEESCEFYGVKDSVSQCRYPRSCRDCLQMPGCYLNGNGRCVDASSSSIYYSDDYRDVIQQDFYNDTYPYIPSSWNKFPANETTYCQAVDPVCIKCRDHFEQRAADGLLGTEFCVGENGCVCIGICEIPEYVPTYAVYGSENDCKKPGASVATKKVETKSFTSVKRDPRAPPINLFTLTRPETCAHYSPIDVQGNSPPRTCQDCLLKEGCAISGSSCVEMSEYRWQSDFRTAELKDNVSSTSYADFPSVNSTYCPMADPICSKCRDEFRRYDNDLYYSYYDAIFFCVGEGGCVCIQPCESSGWIDRQDSIYSPPFNHSPATALAIGFGGLLLIGILSMVYNNCTASGDDPTRTRSGRTRRPPQILRHMVDQVPSLPRQLSLSGWRGFRRNLVHKENQRLNGELDPPVVSTSSEATAEFVEVVDDQEQEDRT